MSAGVSRRGVFKGDVKGEPKCRWDVLEEEFKGGSTCRLEGECKGLEEEFGGRPRCRREGLEEEFKGGLKCKAAALAFSGFWFLSTKWCKIAQIEGFSRTTAPGRLGKISICAVLQHFVNRNQEEFKGGPRCRRDGLESRRGV